MASTVMRRGALDAKEAGAAEVVHEMVVAAHDVLVLQALQGEHVAPWAPPPDLHAAARVGREGEKGTRMGGPGGHGGVRAAALDGDDLERRLLTGVGPRGLGANIKRKSTLLTWLWASVLTKKKYLRHSSLPRPLHIGAPSQ